MLDKWGGSGIAMINTDVVEGVDGPAQGLRLGRFGQPFGFPSEAIDDDVMGDVMSIVVMVVVSAKGYGAVLSIKSGGVAVLLDVLGGSVGARTLWSAFRHPK